MTTNSDWHQNNIANTKKLAAWTLAWLISMAVVRFGPEYLWPDHQTLSLVSALINMLLGGMMIWSNKQHLQGLDELQQRIQLQAMGLTLGVGLVLGLALVNLAEQGYLNGQAEISHLVMLMAVTYLIALVIGVRRYQ